MTTFWFPDSKITEEYSERIEVSIQQYKSPSELPRWLPRWDWVYRLLVKRFVSKQYKALNFLKDAGTLSVVKHVSSRTEGLTVKKIEIDMSRLTDSIMEHLWDSQSQLYRIINSDVEYIIVGKGVYYKLEDEARNMSFRLNMQHTSSKDYYMNHTKIQLAGIEIRFVPYFEGVLVMPKMK